MKRLRAVLASVGVLSHLLVASSASAQGVPSAGQDAARGGEPPAPPTTAAPTAAPAPATPPGGTAASPAPPPATPQWGAGYPTRPWQLPAIEVPGEKLPELHEEELIGDYQQPRWTAQRRFPTTRMYVIPAGKAEAEYWLRYTMPTKDPTKRREVRSYYEMGFGLGHRLQFDIYFVTQQEGHGSESHIELKREQLELRSDHRRCRRRSCGATSRSPSRSISSRCHRRRRSIPSRPW